MSSDGKGGLFADAQSLVFNTSAGSYQVPMVTIGLSPRVTVEQAIAGMQTDVNKQIAQVKTDYKNADATLTNSVNAITSKSYITSSCRVAASTRWEVNGDSVVQCNADEVVTGGGGNTWCSGGYGGPIHVSQPDGNGWVIDQDGGNRTCSNTYAICCKKS
jgi:hypothetical protein